MVHIIVEYNKLSIPIDVDKELYNYIGDPYVSVDDQVISVDKKIRSCLKMWTPSSKISENIGEFLILPDGQICSKPKLEKVDYGDIIFFSDTKTYTLTKIKLNILTKQSLYDIAFKNFEYRPGYILDLYLNGSVLNDDSDGKYEHLMVIECRYIPISEWNKCGWYLYEGIDKNLKISLGPKLLADHSSSYIQYTQLTLSYADKILDQNKSLYEQHVSPFAKYEVVCDRRTAYYPNSDIFIFVKNLIGTSITIPMSYMETIYNLKQKIENIEGVPIESQGFIFAGRYLSNDMSIKEARLSDECTVHLYLRLRGGMLQSTSGRQNFEMLQMPKTKYYLISKSHKIELEPHIKFSAIQKICAIWDSTDFTISTETIQL